MSARSTAFAFAVLAIALTLTQDVFPARDWYHSWQYTTIVAIERVADSMSSSVATRSTKSSFASQCRRM